MPATRIVPHHPPGQMRAPLQPRRLDWPDKVSNPAPPPCSDLKERMRIRTIVKGRKRKAQAAQIRSIQRWPRGRPLNLPGCHAATSSPAFSMRTYRELMPRDTHPLTHNPAILLRPDESSLSRRSRLPTIRLERISPEEFLLSRQAFPRYILSEKSNRLGIRRKMVAVRPIASIHDFVFSEYLPKLIEYSLVSFEIGNNTPIFLMQNLR